MNEARFVVSLLKRWKDGIVSCNCRFMADYVSSSAFNAISCTVTPATALELEVRDDPASDRHRSHFRKGGQ
jgi:hypothetical protein